MKTKKLLTLLALFISVFGFHNFSYSMENVIKTENVFASNDKTLVAVTNMPLMMKSRHTGLVLDSGDDRSVRVRQHPSNRQKEQAWLFQIASSGYNIVSEKTGKYLFAKDDDNYVHKSELGSQSNHTQWVFGSDSGGIKFIASNRLSDRVLHCRDINLDTGVSLYKTTGSSHHWWSICPIPESYKLEAVMSDFHVSQDIHQALKQGVKQVDLAVSSVFSNDSAAEMTSTVSHSKETENIMSLSFNELKSASWEKFKSLYTTSSTTTHANVNASVSGPFFGFFGGSASGGVDKTWHKGDESLSSELNSGSSSSERKMSIVKKEKIQYNITKSIKVPHHQKLKVTWVLEEGSFSLPFTANIIIQARRASDNRLYDANGVSYLVREEVGLRGGSVSGNCGMSYPLSGLLNARVGLQDIFSAKPIT